MLPLVLRTSLQYLYGLPCQLVSDNGPQFTSFEFEHFLKLNGVKHILSTPYHPATNGAAERLVKSVKRALKAGGKSDFHQVLSAFLLRTRITPHSTTNKAPAELFLKRSLRTRFDLLRPSAEEQGMMRQSMQKTYHDQHSRSREFFVGQRVLARNFRAGQRWLPGTITERRGPLSYLVQLQQGILCKRHIDQLLEATDSPASCPDRIPWDEDSEPVPDHEPSNLVPLPAPDSESPSSSSAAEHSAATDHEHNSDPVSSDEPATEAQRRYPVRTNRRPPQRYEPGFH